METFDYTHNLDKLDHRQRQQVGRIPARPDLGHLGVDVRSVLLHPGDCLLLVVKVRHLQLGPRDPVGRGQAAHDIVLERLCLLGRVGHVLQLLGLDLASAMTAVGRDVRPVRRVGENGIDTLFLEGEVS